MIIPNIWESKKCSKPPTRYPLVIEHLYGFVSIEIVNFALKMTTFISYLKLQGCIDLDKIEQLDKRKMWGNIIYVASWNTFRYLLGGCLFLGLQPPQHSMVQCRVLQLCLLDCKILWPISIRDTRDISYNHLII